MSVNLIWKKSQEIRISLQYSRCLFLVFILSIAISGCTINVTAPTVDVEQLTPPTITAEPPTTSAEMPVPTTTTEPPTTPTTLPAPTTTTEPPTTLTTLPAPTTTTEPPTTLPAPTTTTTKILQQQNLNQDPSMSADEIYSLVSPSIPFIATTSASGSGILIEGGYIVTNYHVVEPFKFVRRIVFPDRSEFWDVPVVGWDEQADLAVLGPVNVSIPYLTLEDGEDMELGSELFLIGYPAEFDSYPMPTITSGILSRYREWEGITYLQTDADSTGGQSGGALVNSQGRIVGISTYTFSEAGFILATSSTDNLPIIDNLIRTRSYYSEPELNKYISVIKSVENSQDFSQIERIRNDLEAEYTGWRFAILLSDDYASLRSGYWVVYAGPFNTPTEAQHACWNLDLRTPNVCYGRHLSQDPEDRDKSYAPVAPD